MELYHSFAIIIVLATIFSFINIRYVKLPSTIALMVMAIITSLALSYVGKKIYPDAVERLSVMMGNINFYDVLMNGMLNFLLFAGAIHTNINSLKKQRLAIFTLSTISVTLSTLLVGGILYWALGIMNMDRDILYCLLFGALISPTDPIAVLSILKTANVSNNIKVQIAGESLFNDGVAVVLFSIILTMINSNGVAMSAGDIGILFLEEAGGGIALGLILGYIGSLAIYKAGDYKFSILVTLSVVMGGFLIARQIHASAPLAMVAAGLVIGNSKKIQSLCSSIKEYLGQFWEFLDEILNAVLFLLIGLQIIIMPHIFEYWYLGVLCIVVVLLSRFLSIYVPSLTMRFRKRKLSPRTLRILVWGGLRGGVSIALALSAPESPFKPILLACCYFVVIFSIVVQGLTIKRVAAMGEPEETKE